MKELLYLGLDPGRYKTDKILVHRPIIQIEKKPIDQKIKEAFLQVPKASIILLTSRQSARIFFEYCALLEVRPQEKVLYLAVGRATALLLPSAISMNEESSEGIGEFIKQIDKDRLLFYPHSEQAREVIASTLSSLKIKNIGIKTYDSLMHPDCNLDDLDRFDEIVFTSPSCVRFFFQKKNRLSSHVKLTTIGTITQNVLIQFLKQGKVT